MIVFYQMPAPAENHRAVLLKIFASVLSPGLSVLENIFGLGGGTERMLYGKRKPPHKSLLVSYAGELLEKEKHEKEEDIS